MAEMASSVAHESNQTLTAITKYATADVAYQGASSIDSEAMLAELRQDVRSRPSAPADLKRIRSFVKTKRAEPETPARRRSRTLVQRRGLELAGIETAAAQTFAAQSYVAARLPVLRGTRPDRTGDGQS